MLLRIASFDFGPVHTSLCLADVCPRRRVVQRILEWKVFDWRHIMMHPGAPDAADLSVPGIAAAPAALPTKPIDAMSVAELRALIAAWEGAGRSAPGSQRPDSNGKGEEPGESGTARRAEAGRRPELVARAKQLRKIHFPKIKSTFFSSYGKYTEMIFAQLNAALELDRPDAPLDVVLLEHQPAHFRYENAVVESMIAQHIVTMTRLPSRRVPPAKMHFLSPAFKFRAFADTVARPKAESVARGRGRRSEAARHAANKRYSIDCCIDFLGPAAGPALRARELRGEDREDGEEEERLLQAAHALAAFLDWTRAGRKVDDLADALIQIVSALHSPLLLTGQQGAARAERKQSRTV